MFSNDEKKPRIKIRKPFGTNMNRPNFTGSSPSSGPGLSLNEKLEEVQKELRNLKKSMGRLSHISNQEEEILKENEGKTIHVITLDSITHKGLLHDISKFQVMLKKDNILYYIYKSSIVYYHF